MPIPALRCKQSTTTTGTGTLTLQAAGASARSFRDAFGASSAVVRYVISGGSFYEIGIGTYDGGSPGTLTRSTILASSNAGATVSLPAGTADVSSYLDPLDRPTINTSASSLTLGLADLGSFVNAFSAGAITINLPAIATVPEGAAYEFRNSAGGTMTIDPSGAETINGVSTLSVAVNEWAFVRKSGSAWVGRNYT